MSQGTERAVAAVVRNRDDRRLVLAVLRPDSPDEELPGIWGLPATTLRPGETPQDGLRRLGLTKLGVPLTLWRLLAAGEQRRPGRTLRMELYEAEGETDEPQLITAGEPGVTYYQGWRWAEPNVLAERGSSAAPFAAASSSNRRSAAISG